MKEGFKKLGREFLGLDGCFMKGFYPGHILTAVGVDGNIGIYPVAFAIVEDETFKSWCWFLKILRDDLELPLNTNFTFISDKENGLIPAFSNMFPNAEDRFCVRHISENMKKEKWRGDINRNLMWKCAVATSIPFFDKAMEDVKNHEISLYEWLKQIPAKTWSRAHFGERSKCDIMLNNVCEVFYKQLVGARDKPIITCIEYIWSYMTKRIANVHKIQAKSEGPLTPGATAIFNAIKREASQYNVNGPRGNQCAVDVDQKTCSCRKWQLTGMPCRHAVAVIWEMSSNDMGVGLPENYVSEIYWLDTWKNVYKHTIDPILGQESWPKSECPTTLIPQKIHVPTGRPKKKRKKSMEEVEEERSDARKLSRKGTITTCSKCKNPGHNSRSCKRQGETSSASTSKSAANCGRKSMSATKGQEAVQVLQQRDKKQFKSHRVPQSNLKTTS